MIEHTKDYISCAKQRLLKFEGRRREIKFFPQLLSRKLHPNTVIKLDIWNP